MGAGRRHGENPRTDAREVVRFSPTERAFHWAFAIPFLGMLLSGLPLSFPSLRAWIDGYTPEIGLRLHLACAVAWILGPLLVVTVGHRKALATVVSDLSAIAREEWLWARNLPRWLLGLPCEMTGVGKFNAGQKLNASFIAAMSVLFAMTGVILWVGWQSPSMVGRVIVGWSRRLHYLATLLILAPLFGHIVLATIHPRSRASLRGMLFGVVDADWARDHHPAWYAEVGGELNGPERLEGPGSSDRDHEGP